MKGLSVRSFISLLLLVPLSKQSLADTYLGMRSGWRITYLEGENNACSAAGTFDGNTTFEVFLVGKARIWAVGISNPSWNSVENDREYNAKFIFDGRRAWTGVAKGTQQGIFAIDLKDSFFEELARSYTLEILADGRRLDRISLRGTRSAINAVVDCYDARISNSDPFADGNSE